MGERTQRVGKFGSTVASTRVVPPVSPLKAPNLPELNDPCYRPGEGQSDDISRQLADGPPVQDAPGTYVLQN